MDRSEFVAGVGKILQSDLSGAPDDHPIDPVLWDSIEILGVIALIDRAGRSVKVADIQRCDTLGDVAQLAGL
jgi:hypothetical protein